LKLYSRPALSCLSNLYFLLYGLKCNLIHIAIHFCSYQKANRRYYIWNIYILIYSRGIMKKKILLKSNASTLVMIPLIQGIIANHNTLWWRNTITSSIKIMICLRLKMNTIIALYHNGQQYLWIWFRHTPAIIAYKKISKHRIWWWQKNSFRYKID